MFGTYYRKFSGVRLAHVGLVIAMLGPGLSMAAEVVGTVFRGSIPQRDVKVSLGEMGAVSDDTGRFLFRNVRPARYNLICGNAAPVQVQIRDGLNQVRCQV